MSPPSRRPGFSAVGISRYTPLVTLLPGDRPVFEFRSPVLIRVEIARGPGDKRPRRRFGDDDRRDGRGREEWGWRGREDERRGRDDYDRRRRDDDDRGDREGRYRNSDGDYRSREEDYGRRRERSRSRSDDRRYV
ncbi:hypothetical protein TGMAS_415660 [Toxoplasma gondii MAS]|uniref:RNA recognition motif-containing protein n=1 Tax=Toxoplasma gondii MAS TaxID=943118 RepID=A0A086Q706_TOXGO|nr:hypothetical protein TGMAS_415660 [Toxoplasma gondii MAS]